jgi:hypothetical protein
VESATAIFFLPTIGYFHRPAVTIALDVLGRTVQPYSQMSVRPFSTITHLYQYTVNFDS